MAKKKEEEVWILNGIDEYDYQRTEVARFSTYDDAFVSVSCMRLAYPRDRRIFKADTPLTNFRHYEIVPRLWALVALQCSKNVVLARFSTRKKAEDYVEASRLSRKRYSHTFKSRSLLSGYGKYEIVEYVPQIAPPLDPDLALKK